MSEENVESIRRAFEAYEQGDLDAAVANIAPDCEYVAAGTVPGRTGTYRGPEGYRTFVAWLREEFSDAHGQIDTLIDAGDSVVVGATLSGRGRQSGIPASFTFWQVWKFNEDGQSIHGQGFADKADALEAAGLSE
jgi:ketosteroid isomerase-like protein